MRAALGGNPNDGGPCKAFRRRTNTDAASTRVDAEVSLVDDIRGEEIVQLGRELKRWEAQNRRTNFAA